jgi:hypothetical protein
MIASSLLSIYATCILLTKHLLLLLLLLPLPLLSPPLQEHGDVQAHHQAQRRLVGVCWWCPQAVG